MTKKILIDETVMRQALEVVTKELLAIRDELAERGGRPKTNAFHQRLWDSSRAAYVGKAIPAGIAIGEALKVNNKGVNDLAEQGDNTVGAVLQERLRQEPGDFQQDTLYLLRRLLSNQHTLTGYEFREELTKIVHEAMKTLAEQPAEPVDHFLEDFAGDKGRWQQCTQPTQFTVPLYRGAAAEIGKATP